MMKKIINLLPPQEQNQIVLAGNVRKIRIFGICVSATMVLMIVVLFTIQIFLNSELELTNQQVAQASSDLSRLQGTSINKKVESLNNDLNNFRQISEQNVGWSPIFLELAGLLPKNIVIDSIMINGENRKIELTGIAGTRNSVLQLRENILASPYFENVNFPLSNLQTARDVKWKYRFYFKQEAFK